MNNQNRVAEKEKKFYFDMHNFDEHAIKDEDIIPTFSLEQLEAAKKEAFEQGRKEALAEAAAFREQVIARLLERIAQNFSTLFTAETLRESMYEKESVRLSLAIMEKLFPALVKSHGFGELKGVIEEVLTSQHGAAAIRIEVPAGMRQDIENLLSELSGKKHDVISWIIEENSDLSADECRLSWKDGGAIRHARETANEIASRLKSLIGENNPKASEKQNYVIKEENASLQDSQPPVSGDRT